MKNIDIFCSILEGSKGRFVGLGTKKTITLKDTTEVTKISRYTAQIGVEYDNKKAVIEGRESGELPSENQGLTWGVWYKYPLVIEYKGTYYMRAYLIRNKNYRHGIHLFGGHKIQYFIGDEEVELSNIIDRMYAKDKPKAREENHDVVLTIPINSIIELKPLQDDLVEQMMKNIKENTFTQIV